MTSSDLNPWGIPNPPAAESSAPDSSAPNSSTPDRSGSKKPILTPKGKAATAQQAARKVAQEGVKRSIDLTPDPNTAQLPAHLDLWKQSIQWQPSEHQLSLFQQLYEQMLAANRQLNLTRITEPDEFWEKHLWDSLSGLAPWISEESKEKEPAADAPDSSGSDSSGSDSNDSDLNDADGLSGDELPGEEGPIRVIDIGTGAGFPGIPAAIAFSETLPIDLTLVDATRKKVQFLQLITQQLGLKATCIAERAETLGHQSEHREQYDLALIRAVGPAATCVEYAMPFLKPGGQLVLFRGQWSTEDTESLLPVVDLLGGEIADLQNWETPITKSDRTCLFIYKDAPTPADFPRAVGTPAKKPLT